MTKRLEAAVKSIKKSDLDKSAIVIFRTTAAEKADMQRIAKSLGLTLTEMLTKLFSYAKDKLK